MELISWLEERAANCRRIAATKHGADRSGWLEDEAYFRSAVTAINQCRRLREALEAINGALNMGFAAAEVLDENSPIRDAMREALTPNVEFSGVPAGHSSNHPAGGTSAGTQG